MYTGYWIDNNFIYGPKYLEKFYIKNGYIHGPFNSGIYYIQKGVIRGPGLKGEFFVGDDNRIYGPDKNVPWIRKSI